MKLWLDLSNTVLLTLFSFDDKQTVGDLCESDHTTLTKNFVLFHLNFEHITRETIVHDQTRSLTKSLLIDGKDVTNLVMEDTNLYVQMNGNNRVQRKL